MVKILKKGLKILLIFIALLALIALGIYFYANSKFLSFENGYAEKTTPFEEITVDGIKFLDRNGNNKLDTYEDSRKSIEDRTADLLSQMTLEEKIHLLKGSGLKSAMGLAKDGIAGAVGTIVPTPRLGIPTIYLSDGPAGLRIEPKRKNDDKSYYCSAFPIGSLLASTWNINLVEEVGHAMGNEALEYGIDVILGPGANIQRNPLCGRNFEYYSEDPILTGNIGAAMVNGIQSNGIGTSVKHFVANNQETNRNNNDVLVSERAMREIYLKGFEVIVKKSQPWTIMTSYNKVNGIYTSESKKLLTEILRNDWKFDGVVMSDWFGGNDAAAQVNAGNDLLEPGTKNQWDALLAANKGGVLSPETIDIAAERILMLILKSKKMQAYKFTNNPDLKQHAALTRQSASEGMVLLKNKNTLPLQNIKNVALIGITSYEFIAGGTGSGDVNEAYTVSLEEGLKNAGYQINEVAKSAFEKHKAANQNAFVKPEGMKAMFEPYNPPQLSLSYASLEETAKTADIAIITIGRNSGEGGDRKEINDFLMTIEEQAIIENTCKVYHAAGKKVIVVLNVGGVVETASWNAKPDAILLAWQGGQEGGNSVADILSGKVNPSGKLPMTFPIHLMDHASSANFPLDGKPMSMTSFLSSQKTISKDKQVKDVDYTKYEEGIYVGYRHFDKDNKEVAYPFGYGLSFTTFEFSNVRATVANDSISVTVTVSNKGSVAGKEVVQIYSSIDTSSIDRPVKELKAFAKTPLLAPGDATTLTLKIATSELSYWNEINAKWVLEKGNYALHIGTSSRDIRITENIIL